MNITFKNLKGNSSYLLGANKKFIYKALVFFSNGKLTKKFAILKSRLLNYCLRNQKFKERTIYR